MKNQRFCSEEHHEKYVADHHQYAVEELHRRDVDLVASAALSHLPADAAKDEQEKTIPPPEETTAAAAGDSGAKATPGQESLARFLAMVECDRHFYQEILDKTPIGIGVLSEDLSVHYANTTFRQRCGEKGDESQPLTLYDLGLQQDLTALAETVQRSGVPEGKVLLHRANEKPGSTLRVAVIPLMDEQVLLVVEDVSDVAGVREQADAASAG